MALPANAVAELFDLKNPGPDARDALGRCTELGYDEGWALRDGAIVIYNLDTPPDWLPDDPGD